MITNETMRRQFLLNPVENAISLGAERVGRSIPTSAPVPLLVPLVKGSFPVEFSLEEVEVVFEKPTHLRWPGFFVVGEYGHAWAKILAQRLHGIPYGLPIFYGTPPGWVPHGRGQLLVVLLVTSALEQSQLPLLLESGNSKRADSRNTAEFQRS